MQRSSFLASGIAVAAAIAAPVKARADSPDTLGAAAVRAYTFAYPLVLVAITERDQVAVTGRNRFRHDRRLAVPENRFIVRPNVDTLYSSAFVDLAGGPVLLTIPVTSGHFYVCEVMDAWTNVFADPGTRTIGGAAGRYVFVGPGQNVDVPSGITRVDAPTNSCWFFNRIALHAGTDVAAVHALQDGFTLAPFPGGTAPPGEDHGAADPANRAKLVAQLEAAAFFGMASRRLVGNPPQAVDAAGLRDLAHLGIVPGHEVDFATLGAPARDALAAAPAVALQTITSFTFEPSALTPTGWLRPDRTIGRFGADDLLRARVGFYGLAANLPEDAIYFATRGSGARIVRMRFAAGSLPPADGFWSLTMYDVDGFLVPNAAQRYALRSGDAFVADPDGGLTLELGPNAPADAARAANWLPAPGGPYTLLLRLYAPHPEALDGRWIPPALLPA